MQLPLPVRLPDEASFANFHAHAGAAAALAHLRHGLAQPGFGALLHGPRACGRTHLLQASCHLLEQQGATIAWLPMAELVAFPAAQLLEGLEGAGLVCIDDLDVVAGNSAWEEALFHFYNRLQQHGASLLVAADAPPGALRIVLPDLRSRLSQLLVLALAAPDEEALRETLMLRARLRGLEMDAEVARYIVHRAERTQAALVALLDRLDARSLAAARRLSIPFVKDVMGW